MRKRQNVSNEYAKHLPDAVIDWLLWNRTAFPFCSFEHMLRQLASYITNPRDEQGNPEPHYGL